MTAFAPAGRSRVAWITLLLTAGLGIVIDLVSKSLAFRWIADDPVAVTQAEVLSIGPQALQSLVPYHEPVVVIPHVLNFHLVLNSGAVFGAGQGFRWFFIAFTLTAMAFASLIFSRWTDKRERMTHIALGLIISGGLGNLYDRIQFACVRDFLHPLPTAHFPLGLSWPGGDTALWPYVSNVADAFLLIGIGMIMIRLWRAPAKPRPAR